MWFSSASLYTMTLNSLTLFSFKSQKYNNYDKSANIISFYHKSIHLPPGQTNFPG